MKPRGTEATEGGTVKAAYTVAPVRPGTENVDG